MSDLIEAYHTIYDAKDANFDNDDARMAAYEALSWLAILMRNLNVEVPKRYDGDGRP